MDISFSNRTLRRMLGMVFLFIFCMAIVPSVSAEAVLDLASESAILMNADTGQILYEKNCHKEMYPASITKVMTGLLALENLKPDDLLTVSEAAVKAVPRTSSHFALQPGEEITAEQAMYALAIGSANDAANVLAEAVSGDLTSFAQLMTEKAEALGARNTHFTNANGLPDAKHYTSAYDMALITAEALTIPGFIDFFSTPSYICPPTNLFEDVRSLTNLNQILFGPYSYEGVLMSKTGWTSAALGTLVTAAKQGDVTLIAVVMRSQLLEDKYEDTCKLFDYGFSQYFSTELTGEEVAAHLDLGDYAPVTGQTFSFLLVDSTDPSQIRFSLADDSTPVNAPDPITVHASVGERSLPSITLMLKKKPQSPEPAPSEINNPELVSQETAESSSPVWLLLALLPAAAAIAAVIFLMYPHKKNRNKTEITAE